MNAQSPIETYLAELRSKLPLRARARIVTEFRAHLVEAALEETDKGLSRIEAERVVVERFGPVDLVAEQLRSEWSLERRKSRVVVVAVIAAVAASAAGLVIDLGRGPGPHGVLFERGAVSGEIGLRAGIQDASARGGKLVVVSNGGAAWGNEGADTVRYVIDERTIEVGETTRSNPNAPLRFFPHDRARAFGSLWINVGSNQGSSTRFIERVDPASGKVVAIIKRPEAGDLMAAPAPLRHRLWIAYGGFGGEIHLKALDPGTNRFVGRPIVVRSRHYNDDFIAWGLYATADSLWLVTSDSSEPGTRVWRIDPTRRKPVASLHVRAAQGIAGWPAFDGRWLWVFSDRSAYRITLPDRPAPANRAAEKLRPGDERFGRITNPKFTKCIQIRNRATPEGIPPPMGSVCVRNTRDGLRIDGARVPLEATPQTPAS